MSYSNINDAFFINPVSDEKNLYKNDYKEFNNINSNYTNFTDVETNYDNTSNESLNGTQLKNLVEKKLLTHRDCINIYCNIDECEDNDVKCALKHISNCTKCKDVIKIRKEQSKNQSNTVLKNEIKSEQLPNFNNTNEINTNLKNQNNLNINPQIELNNIYEPLKINNIEQQIKTINEKIIEDNNIKNQNLILQNTISKYLKEIDDKKVINNKIDKILELISSPYYKSCNNVQQENENLNDYYKKYNNYSFEINYISIGICVIIILLLIDIILRVLNK